jgi:phosphate-selective porin OprO/OprP
MALTIAAACGLSAVATGQDGQPPAEPRGAYDADEAPADVGKAGGLRILAAEAQPGQPPSFDQVASAEGVLPTPPPPTAENTDRDLAERVANLEKQLAQAKQSTPAKPAAPTKPLVTPSGRIQFDAATFSQDAASRAQFGNVRDAVGFRRARLALLGEYQTIDYIIEMDFANRGADALINTKAQSTAFKDVYVQMRDLPVLNNVRIGHFKEPFGLEQMTSDNYTTFMERSIDDEGAFVPGRNNGIMSFDWSEDQRATWAFGAFTNQTGIDQPPLAQFTNWGVDLTGRFTYLPWYDEASGGRGLLHTGIDYAYRSAPDDLGTFAARPEAAFGPGVVNLRLAGTDYWQVLGTETAFVYGPLSLQSEFFTASANRLNGTTNNFYGTYAFISYFLTGESRPYNRKMGVFDRVRPYEDFFRVRTGDGNVATGMGAWEVGYRFSYIDMLDGLPTAGAGRATDHTLGLTWYMNPNTRAMFNYIHSFDTFNPSAGRTVSGGNLDIFETRLAIDF